MHKPNPTFPVCGRCPIVLSWECIPPTVWAAGEVVQEQVQISAAKLQAGSSAVWMGMDAPVNQMRAAVEAGHERLLHNAGVDAEPIPELEFDQTSGW